MGVDGRSGTRVGKRREMRELKKWGKGWLKRLKKEEGKGRGVGKGRRETERKLRGEGEERKSKYSK